MKDSGTGSLRTFQTKAVPPTETSSGIFGNILSFAA